MGTTHRDARLLLERIATPRHRRPERGFTLIELLVVIVILGIMAGVVVFAVRGAGDKGWTSAIATDRRTLVTALEVYCAKHGHYPKADPELPGDTPMAVLVREKLLSSESTYHILTTGDDPPEFDAGNCPNPPMKYHLEPTRPDPNQPVGLTGGGTWEKTTGDLAAGAAPDQSFAVTLQDGKVLHLGPELAEIFYPNAPLGNGLWIPTVPKPPGDSFPVAIPLPGEPSLDCLSCGKVLVYQMKFFPKFPYDDWYIFDPVTGSWSSAGRPKYLRPYGPSLALVHGRDCGAACPKVLVVGGGVTDIANPKGYLTPEARTGAELFDPKDNTWTETGALPSDSGDQPSMISMGGGALLLIDSPVIFDADLGGNGGWRDAAVYPDGRNLSGAGMALLPGGRVLVMPGPPNDHIYDPSSGDAGEWLPGPDRLPGPGGCLNGAQGCITGAGKRAVTLQNGKVLVAGHFWESGQDRATTGYLFDPNGPLEWTPTGRFALDPRKDPSVAALQDGRALMVAGDQPGVQKPRTSELYTPAG